MYFFHFGIKLDRINFIMFLSACGVALVGACELALVRACEFALVGACEVHHPKREYFHHRPQFAGQRLGKCQESFPFASRSRPSRLNVVFCRPLQQIEFVLLPLVNWFSLNRRF